MSNRRDFLKAGGALVIGLHLGKDAVAQAGQGAGARGAAPANQPDARQIDTWLAIHSDETATLYIGFAELGQGTTTALPQVAAEELDLDIERINTVHLDTTVTPNQGGTYSSASIARGGPQIRTAAAEARKALARYGVRKARRSGRSFVGSQGRRDGDGRAVALGYLRPAHRRQALQSRFQRFSCP